MSRRIAILLVASTAIFTAAVPTVRAQQQPAAAADEMVQLNFPQEIEVKILVDYVSQRLKIKILYDDVIANKRLVVRAPEAIPASSLLAVLESCLKMKGLIMVEADAPGWKRIVAVNRLQNVAPFGDPQEAMEEHGRGTPVTQAFVLKHAAPSTVEKYIKPFMTDPGANSIAIDESGMLIVSDYALNLLKLTRWIESLDKPRPAVVLETYVAKHVEVATLAPQLQRLMAAQMKAIAGQAATLGEIAFEGDLLG
ncbi:MAG: secretin N-terminal domain-containing protein [Planctomycetaceae bacterium]